jgi:hypothetical protein
MEMSVAASKRLCEEHVTSLRDAQSLINKINTDD